GANGNHVFKGFKIGIYAAHVCYWPRNLNAIAFYALMKDDKELGKKVADALVNYYKLREPLIDKQNARGDDPNAEGAWPADLWRGMHYVAGESHLGFAYDLTAMHMTKEQKDFMRKIIVKATANKRSYGANGPVRWRDTNWVGWDTQHALCHLAIEGEEGYQQEIVDNMRETVYGYLTYGISPYGTIFESNGKNSAGFQFAMDSLVAIARRGHEYLLGHPHLRKLAASQIQQVVPAGGRNSNNGTYGCTLFKEAGYLKNLFPGDKAADWLILQGQPRPEKLDLEKCREELMKEKSLYRISPMTADMYLGEAAFEGMAGKETWERDYLNLPLDYEDPQHGQMCMRSSNGKDALYMMMECRGDLYTGGHQHHDAGHFYLSADGVNWGVEGNDGIRSSLFHSIVLIDGMGQGAVGHCAPAKAEWLGAVINENAAIAKTNQKHAYDYIWCNPMHYSWENEERKAYKWEIETDPEVVKCFKGTKHYKCRIWMHSYWDENWGPQMRAPYNPVQYAFRTAGIIRGPHPYALVVDDIRKDDQNHVYEWQMQLPEGVVLASWWKMPDGLIVLARRSDCKIEKFITPNKGAPCLAVLVLEKTPEPQQTQANFCFAPAEIRTQSVTGTDRLVIATRAIDTKFKIAMVPFRFGDPVPTADMEDGKARIKWARVDAKTKKETTEQQDEIIFTKGKDNRTIFTVGRDGKALLDVK
ncbi:MAG: hypothetical protein HY801_12905, partial [Candidatus Lindowbacteria bacterium]|nr:hypothetical protein [Candidatus Lindowbacteria bacterium]